MVHVSLSTLVFFIVSLHSWKSAGCIVIIYKNPNIDGGMCTAKWVILIRSVSFTSTLLYNLVWNQALVPQRICPCHQGDVVFGEKRSGCRHSPCPRKYLSWFRITMGTWTNPLAGQEWFKQRFTRQGIWGTGAEFRHITGVQINLVEAVRYIDLHQIYRYPLRVKKTLGGVNLGRDQIE